MPVAIYCFATVSPTHSYRSIRRMPDVVDQLFSSDDEAIVADYRNSQKQKTEQKRCEDYADTLWSSPDRKRPKATAFPDEEAPIIEHGGNNNALQGEAEAPSWHLYKVALMSDGKWWTWKMGIIDRRLVYRTSPNQSEGFKLHRIFWRMYSVLAERACFYKVGIAQDLAARWEMYQESESSWKPSHLFILSDEANREAAGYVEAALIRENKYRGRLKSRDVNDINFIRQDPGGTGPRKEGPYFVYLAVSPATE